MGIQWLYLHVINESCHNLAFPPDMSQYSLVLTICLQVSSAHNLCKQFGPRSGPTKRRAWSASKLFESLMVFLKNFIKKMIFLRNSADTKTWNQNSISNDTSDMLYKREPIMRQFKVWRWDIDETKLTGIKCRIHFLFVNWSYCRL